MRMMQDCGGGKYNVPTAKGLERIWNVMIFVKIIYQRCHKAIAIPSILREARAVP